MTATTNKRLTVGSWSSGSTRTEDLLQAAVDMAESINMQEVGPIEDAAHVIEAINAGDDHVCDWDECLDPSETLDRLIEQLNNYAPIYCYIGMVEGDGADFGVWPSWEAIDDAKRHGISIFGDTGEYILNAEDNVVIHTSDHGNVEVFEIALGKSLLALV